MLNFQTANFDDPQVRLRWGALAGGIGIALNLLLFAAKLTTGLLCASVALVGDALNNLSDAGASVVTLVGFRLAGREADQEHPFGHGRMEYVAGLIVALGILLMGVEVGRCAMVALFDQSDTEFSLAAGVVLAGCIAVKVWMFFFQRGLGRKMDSQAMAAAAADSLADAAATGVVVVCALGEAVFHLRLDGLAGLLVAALILKAGWQAAAKTLDPLLGRGMRAGLAQEIEALAAQCPGILGVHDFLYHDYGPGRASLSFHAEVPAQGDMVEIHNQIDRLERTIHARHGIQTVIHMDPVQKDPLTCALREQAEAQVRALDPALHIHDFRLLEDQGERVMAFDLVVPYGFAQSDSALCAALGRSLQGLEGGYRPVISPRRPYMDYDLEE